MRLVAGATPETAPALAGALTERQLFHVTDYTQVIAWPVIDDDRMRLRGAGRIGDAGFAVEVALLADRIASLCAQARRMIDVGASWALPMLPRGSVALFASDGLQGSIVPLEWQERQS